MKSFKFFQKEGINYFELIGLIARGIDELRTQLPIMEEEITNEGWRAHMNNLPPGQCPYDIGTRERELWLDGWSVRADYIIEDDETI